MLNLSTRRFTSMKDILVLKFILKGETGWLIPKFKEMVSDSFVRNRALDLSTALKIILFIFDIVLPTTPILIVVPDQLSIVLISNR